MAPLFQPIEGDLIGDGVDFAIDFIAPGQGLSIQVCQRVVLDPHHEIIPYKLYRLLRFPFCRASIRPTCLGSAKTQITRLDRLIKNLVELSRTEETIKRETVEVFSVSEIAQANEDAFQYLAEADGKSLAAEIMDGISTKGIENNFFHLFSILLDNAAKYCDTTGAICLSAFRGGGISILYFHI